MSLAPVCASRRGATMGTARDGTAAGTVRDGVAAGTVRDDTAAGTECDGAAKKLALGTQSVKLGMILILFLILATVPFCLGAAIGEPQTR